VYHVGDTLHDVKAAREAGVRGIGVATGGSTFEALTASEWSPYAVFRDLSDTAAVLAALEI
jgi:phosphoglycolate phosphatase